MKKIILSAVLIFVVLAAGCETLPVPTTKELLSNPIGTSPLRRGMPKEEVTALWGQPNEVIRIGQDELGIAKEEWVYHARYPALPVDYNYLSETKHLIFQGDNLTNWDDK